MSCPNPHMILYWKMLLSISRDTLNFDLESRSRDFSQHFYRKIVKHISFAFPRAAALAEGYKGSLLPLSSASWWLKTTTILFLLLTLLKVRNWDRAKDGLCLPAVSRAPTDQVPLAKGCPWLLWSHVLRTSVLSLGYFLSLCSVWPLSTTSRPLPRALASDRTTRTRAFAVCLCETEPSAWASTPTEDGRWSEALRVPGKLVGRAFRWSDVSRNRFYMSSILAPPHI